MKNFLLFLLFIASANISAQYAQDFKPEKTSSITVGLLQNATLIGAEFETMAYKDIGVQLGAGVLGYSAGIDLHFDHSIRSSSISCQYFVNNLGGDRIYNSWATQFIYRGKKWLTMRAGLIHLLSSGTDYTPNFYDGQIHGFFFLLSIGAYFPI